MKAKTVIVEDEPLAARALRDMLKDEPWVDIVDEIADGQAAIATINRLRPDLVFLDIQLPEVTGLDVLRALDYKPAVVFTTAYDQFAVSAFELAAVDYLLKPFGRDRLNDTLNRVRRALSTQAADDSTSRAATALDTAAIAGSLDRIFVRDRDAIVPVTTREIERLEANDDYVTIYASGRRYLASVPMNEMERRLDATRFARIHRSHIVNLEQVASLTSYDASRLLITMKSGAKLVASRASSRRLRELAL